MNETNAHGQHVPVMVREVVHFLEPKPGQTIVDATIGVGGHAHVLVKHVLPDGRLIGFDQDPAMLALAEKRLANLPVTLVQANFVEIASVLQDLQIAQVDGIMADLGFCSDQMEDELRGLSFQTDGPLDMRLNPDAGTTAADILRQRSEKDLAFIFREYGEERFAKRVARKIVAQRSRRPLQTTAELAELVRSCVPRARGKAGRIDPATRVFQALRIAVNDELDVLARFLEMIPSLLKPNGRVVVISFHSLEDRLVKHAFRQKDVFHRLTRKPIQPQSDEIEHNPRARSAKLRSAEKINPSRERNQPSQGRGDQT